MEFSKKDLFITDFWEFEFPYFDQLKGLINDYLDSKEVQKYLESIKNNNPSLTTYGGEEVPIENAPIESLLATQTAKLLKIIEKAHIWEESEWHSFDCWININKQGGFNPPHIHPGQTYSGVYYLSVPEGSGNIHFLDPRPAPIYGTPDLNVENDKNVYSNNNPYDSRVFSHCPREGYVVFFPSWLVHYVDPNPTPSPRISIAFNVKYGEL